MGKNSGKYLIIVKKRISAVFKRLVGREISLNAITFYIFIYTFLTSFDIFVRKILHEQQISRGILKMASKCEL